MQLKAVFPNTLTALNLACGCLGIIMAFQYELIWSGYLIGIAAIFDFFDGLVARLLGVQGELGKQLDSLADCVTFGVLPGIILFQFINIGFGHLDTPFIDRPMGVILWSLTALLVPIFAALRLAKFNIDPDQKTSFMGMPTPAMAIFVGSLPIILEVQYSLNYYHPISLGVWEAYIDRFHLDPFDFWLIGLLLNPWFFTTVSIVLAGLMVAPLPMLSLKFSNFKWKENKARFSLILLVGVSVLMVFIPYWLNYFFSYRDLKDTFFEWLIDWPFIDFAVFPLIIILYLIVSAIWAVIPNRNEIQS